MDTIESILEPITGYVISITRDTLNGWYELTIGIHDNWVFDDNEEIKCEVLQEGDGGKLIKIAPKNQNIIIDDLLKFVKIIIETNERIAAKEEQFKEKMQAMKTQLEEEAKKFYKELDELKDSSFQDAGEDFVKKIQSEPFELETNEKSVEKKKTTIKKTSTPKKTTTKKQ